MDIAVYNPISEVTAYTRSGGRRGVSVVQDIKAARCLCGQARSAAERCGSAARGRPRSRASGALVVEDGDNIVVAQHVLLLHEFQCFIC